MKKKIQFFPIFIQIFFKFPEFISKTTSETESTRQKVGK